MQFELEVVAQSVQEIELGAVFVVLLELGVLVFVQGLDMLVALVLALVLVMFVPYEEVGILLQTSAGVVLLQVDKRLSHMLLLSEYLIIQLGRLHMLVQYNTPLLPLHYILHNIHLVLRRLSAHSLCRVRLSSIVLYLSQIHIHHFLLSLGPASKIGRAHV